MIEEFTKQKCIEYVQTMVVPVRKDLILRVGDYFSVMDIIEKIEEHDNCNYITPTWSESVRKLFYKRSIGEKLNDDEVKLEVFFFRRIGVFYENEQYRPSGIYDRFTYRASKKNLKKNLLTEDYEKIEFEKNLEHLIIGVYFLFYEGECVYVGQSKNLLDRFNSHKSKHKGLRKAFDRSWYFRCSKDNIDELEKKYIDIFKPYWNTIGK